MWGEIITWKTKTSIATFSRGVMWAARQLTDLQQVQWDEYVLRLSICRNRLQIEHHLTLTCLWKPCSGVQSAEKFPTPLLTFLLRLLPLSNSCPVNTVSSGGAVTFIYNLSVDMGIFVFPLFLCVFLLWDEASVTHVRRSCENRTQTKLVNTAEAWNTPSSISTFSHTCAGICAPPQLCTGFLNVKGSGGLGQTHAGGYSGGEEPFKLFLLSKIGAMFLPRRA